MVSIYYILDEEYGDTTNDNNENRQNNAIPIDDESNDIKDVHANYGSKEEIRHNSTKGTVRYDAKARSPVDNIAPLNV